MRKIPLKKTLILGFVSILIIFILFKALINLGEFSSVVRDIDWFYFFLAFSAIVPITVVNAVKWHLIVHSAGYDIPFKTILKIVVSSISLAVLPGRLGDFARIYPLRNKIPRPQALGTIILEKVIDISALLIFAGLGLFILGYTKIAILMLLLAIGGIPFLGMAGYLSGKVLPTGNLTEKLGDAFSVLKKARKIKSKFSMAVISSFINGLLSMLHLYWLFKAVGATVPLFAIFSFHPLSTFAGLLPVTLAGAGTRDSAMIYLFKNFSTPEQSLATGILYGLQTYWILALLGLPLLYYFFREDLDKRAGGTDRNTD